MSRQTKRRSTPTWVVPVAIVTVAVLLIVLVVALGRESKTPEDDHDISVSAPDAPTEVQGPEQQDFSAAERRDAADLMAVGRVDAPVVLVVFSDYQCPFCAQWSQETLPLMMEQVEAGDLRVEWRDVNVFGAASERAARASFAAAQQDAFWEYHDALFAGGEIRSERALGDQALSDLAEDLGLDVEQFIHDFESEQTAAEIADNAQLGLDLGAYSTPAFILGGQPIVGAQPSDVFVDAFDQALAAAE